VRGPSNITNWNFALYREYRSYQNLAFDPPVWNSSSGVWHINVSIPAEAERDLYNLQVTLSDGVSQLELEEWNAVQIRYDYPSNFTIFHITDTHLSPTATGESKRLLYSLYQAALANADLVIITGDLVETAATASLKFFHFILKQSRVPTFICPGNHDRDTTGPGFRTYQSFFGADYYVASFGPNVTIVMANSHGDRILNSTQIRWIERDMAASNAQVKILGFHHPLYYVEKEPPEYFLDPDEAEELIRICSENDVDMVLTGHLHNDRVDRVNGTLWILTTANGGPVWTNPADPGHHQYGFRIIRIENYKPVEWNWTLSMPWSQPWDKVALSRTPSYFYDVDVGGYMTLTNRLDTLLTNQIVDFLVQPIGSGVVYRAEGAPVIETANGSEAWLVRFLVDLPVNETITLRVYPSNAQPPTLLGVSYPEVAVTGQCYDIYANWTNPASGILRVRIEVSIDDGPYESHGMRSLGGGRYIYTICLEEPATVNFRILATDYAGLTTTTETYTFQYTSATTSIVVPPPTSLMLVVGVGVTILVIVAVVVYFLRIRPGAK